MLAEVSRGSCDANERHRAISSLPYISSTVRRRHDFPAGDIESRRIFAGTAEIGAGNDASTMFTQTRLGWKRSRSRIHGVYVPSYVRVLLAEFCTERNLPLVYISIDPAPTSTTLWMRQEFNGPRESKPMGAGQQEFVRGKQRCRRVWKFALAPFASALRDLPCGASVSGPREIGTWNVGWSR